jgi:DNA-3-methyladenine glycosylase
VSRSSRSSSRCSASSSRTISSSSSPALRLSVVDRALFAGPTLEAARGLLGTRLVRDDETGFRSGRIVEVEAYIGVADRASHARFGPTTRNRPMFGPPGHAYVYLVYGMYDCLNIVTEPVGSPAAVLVRAIEPLDGLEQMRQSRTALHATRRKTPPRAPPGPARDLADHRLASGPGLVAAAFGIDVTWTGTDLCDARSPLRLEARSADEPAPSIRATPRIGIAYAGAPWTEHAWRFVIAGHPSASGPVALR